MREIVDGISIEEKSDIKKDLEDIRKYHVSDTRDITIAQEKASAIRRVAEEDCKNFWKYCNFIVAGRKFTGTYKRTSLATCRYVREALGEDIWLDIFRAENLQSVRNLMIERAYYYEHLSNALRKQREEDLSPLLA